MIATDVQICHVFAHYGRFDIPIPHREQRLARFLAAKETTDAILWIYRGDEEDDSWELNHVQDDIYELPVCDSLHWSLFEQPLVTKYYANRHHADKFETVFDEFRSDLNYLWFTKPIIWNLLEFDWDWKVYDCSDHMTSIGRGTRSGPPFTRDYIRLLRSFLKTSTERRIAEEVDTIFASSEFLYERLKEMTPHDRQFLVETGLDFDLFRSTNEKHEEIESIQHPRLGFAGKLKKKIDYGLLSELARRNSGWNIVMIGPKKGVDAKTFRRLLRHENVYWIDHVPHQEMPRVLNALDLGLMPYKDIEYNRGVVPLKFFEYLACELPVVGCCLPSTAKYSQKNVYLHTSNDPVEFSRACETALSWQTGAEARLTLAETADWEEKFSNIYERTVTERIFELQSVVNTRERS